MTANRTIPWKSSPRGAIAASRFFLPCLAVMLLSGRSPAIEVGKRPRIFMSIHGTAGLMNDSSDARWTFVRQNIDGIWYNAAGVGDSLCAVLIRKLKTRKTIQIFNSNVPSSDASGVRTVNLQKAHPDIKLILEAHAFYMTGLDNWQTGQVDSVRNLLVDSDSPWRAPQVMAGFPHNAFTGTTGVVAPLLQPGYAPALANFQSADLIFQETRILQDAVNGIRMAHKAGKPFLWFMGSGSGLENAKRLYAALEPDLREDDRVMIINYGDTLQAVPESDSTTYTGILKWLLGRGSNQYAAKKAPTALSFHPAPLPAKLVAGTTVGTFTTTDPDVGDTFRYGFTRGGADNQAFSIVGNQLKIGPGFAALGKTKVSLLVRSTDPWAFWVERSFELAVEATSGVRVRTGMGQDAPIFHDLRGRRQAFGDRSIPRPGLRFRESFPGYPSSRELQVLF